MLHVDRNEYYGGAEAALSLQEVDTWIEAVNDGNYKRSGVEESTMLKAW